MASVTVDLADKKTLVYDPAVPKKPKSEEPPPPETLDLNQVVAYNIREARLLRGWTQEDLADRLEPYIGTRLTQAGVSSIERGWDSDRRRAFDAQELLVYSLVFDLPILWFLLPPPDDDRFLKGVTARASHLYQLMLGTPDQLEPVYERLRALGIREPTEAERTVEIITGQKSEAREWSYKERRKELLLALLDEHADNFDKRIDELGEIVDHLRQVGLRGFIAEHTNDEDFTFRGNPTAEQNPADTD
jgi:transcriptional regulator with XRE-family HTH domain